MAEIQALRASLANKQVSNEDWFTLLEPNALGFHAHLREGVMTQQLRELPGCIQQLLHQINFQYVWLWPLTPAVLVIYSPEQLSEVEKSS